MNRKSYQIVMTLCLLYMVFCTVSQAQEKPAAQTEFDAVFQQWKQLLEEMRLVQAKASEAEDAELPALKEEFAALIIEGNALIPRLRDAAIPVYKEAPEEDRQISRWLADFAVDYVESDRFQEALPAIQALIDGQTPDTNIFDLAGRATFVLHNFEAAKQHFEAAASTGVLSTQGQSMMAEVDDYIEYWAEEKQLREQEATAPEGKELPLVKMETNKGILMLEMFENEAPEAVGNFISLVENGFYDGLTFHRVLNGFMAQGGCPDGNGMGGPGYEIYCECHGPNFRKHFRGSLSMAHAGRDTGGSQFFLTFIPTANLNAKHTVFGRVTEGMEVLAKLQRRDPSKSEELAITPDRIIKAEVVRKRDHKYLPNKVR